MRPIASTIITCLFLLAGALGGATATAAAEAGDPIAVTTEPAIFGRLGNAISGAGRLTFLSGIEITSDDERFGGLSGLTLSPDGERLVAVSDKGWWLRARLEFEDGRVIGMSEARIGAILGRDGRPLGHKGWSDAEALSPYGPEGADGDLLVGFERRERVERYRFGRFGMAAWAHPVRAPKAISSGRINKELESVVYFWEGPRTGWSMILSEANYDAKGNIRGWLWRKAKTRAFSVERLEDYDITDAAMLPGDTSFLTLERSFSRSSLPGVAIRRFAVADLEKPGPVKGEVLFEGRQPLYAIDNMEGLAVYRTASQQTRIIIVSDDNYNRKVQRTVLFQFALD